MTGLPIYDGHNDTLTCLNLQARRGDRSIDERSDEGSPGLSRTGETALVGGTFAIFTPPPDTSKETDIYHGLTVTDEGWEVPPRSPVEYEYAKRYTDSAIESLQRLLHQADGAVALVHTYPELERSLQDGVFSVVLAIEGAAAIKADLGDLEAYYARGVRSLGVAWSRPNVFCFGVPSRFPHSPDTGPGLTDAGTRLVHECNRLGIMIDLAHINERGFWDVAELSDLPLVVSHAGVHALSRSTRNLTDEQLDAIGESNGLVGIIFYPTMIRADGQRQEDVPVAGIVDHVEYVVERIGVDHVALGADFNGAEEPHELANAADFPKMMRGLADEAGLGRVMQVLQDRGYDRESLEKIAYRNWFRVLRDSWRDGPG